MFVDWWNHRGAYFVAKPHMRPALLDRPEWKHKFIKLKHIQLHFVEMVEGGAHESKPVMLFLHGFPEFWYSWRFQMRHFCAKYRVIAVDLRGYNDSDKPIGIEEYGMELLSADIMELIERLGKQVVLVGHDWGGMIAWNISMERPELLQRLVVMNAPHPKAATKLIRTRSSQLLKSWYIFFFQCPWIPEIFLWARDYGFLETCFLGKPMGLVHRENFTSEDLEAWKHVFSKPNSLTPPLNYYRASMRAVYRRQFTAAVHQPKTLIIWGQQDAALDLEGAELSARLCRDVKVELIPDASHWVQQDVPERVNAVMEVWLAD
ncbi:hypothetical protein niasHS_009127 [Heterodera schachtii]|uniref:AB hydrolase-1 domain-containing protein n=2 Tax=Heterodera TaxID=34509 RepID=A0ABD2JE20_HETSC